MRALLLVLLLLAVAAPAHAEPTCAPAEGATACAQDDAASEGDCAELGYAEGRTGIDAEAGDAAASASGASRCSNDGTLYEGRDEIAVAVRVGVIEAGARWWSVEIDSPSTGYYAACRVELRGFVATAQDACPMGAEPLNPGWGELLPLP